MIDKICIWFFGMLDRYSQWVDQMFVKKPKKKKKTYNPEDLFNGE